MLSDWLVPLARPLLVVVASSFDRWCTWLTGLFARPALKGLRFCALPTPPRSILILFLYPPMVAGWPSRSLSSAVTQQSGRLDGWMERGGREGRREGKGSDWCGSIARTTLFRRAAMAAEAFRSAFSQSVVLSKTSWRTYRLPLAFLRASKSAMPLSPTCLRDGALLVFSRSMIDPTASLSLCDWIGPSLLSALSAGTQTPTLGYKQQRRTRHESILVRCWH